MKSISECKVLIVDDTETNIDILVDVLSDDYELAVAMDGISALEAVELDPPDLILLDIMMPRMDGFTVCKHLKENPVTSHIPVIFLTSVTDTESKSKGFLLGAVDYVTKPFEVGEIKSRVKTHLTLHLAKLALENQNIILEEKVQERTRMLSITQETTIDALAALAEYRDPDTGGHIQRTKNYVRVICNELAKLEHYKNFFNDELIEMYYKSAPLHDIGKVGIRDEVLLKPGKLTDDEFEEMKLHTIIGYNAIKSATRNLGQESFLTQAMNFAKFHQEKWDGTGYPEGLSGEDIPLPGRIMAVADVYDALISKRVYKPPFTHTKAVSIIESESGKHFDPSIVEIFMNNHEIFREIALKYAESDEEREAVSK